jgi:hypothetical protein
MGYFFEGRQEGVADGFLGAVVLEGELRDEGEEHANVPMLDGVLFFYAEGACKCPFL